MINITGSLVAYKVLNILFIVVIKQVVKTTQTISSKMQNLLDKFDDICSAELPPSLPLLRYIQHYIDFIPRSSLPN